MTSFASLGLSPGIVETLTAQGYTEPTLIQAECIPPALEGRDLLGCAQTGTGKTAAFSLPLIERLLARGESGRRGGRRARALVLAPTRELAGQIEDSLRTYGRGSRLRAAVIYGGVKQYGQVRQLRAGVDVIVATPGRLLDLMEQRHADVRGVEMLVLDEADRMLDMGFIDPIRRISSALSAERQTLFFSATMPPKIRALADSMLHEPVRVVIKPAPQTMPKIDQSLYHIATEHKPALLKYLLHVGRVERGVVFTKTKHGADRLADALERDGVSAAAIHGNRSQSQRERTLEAFRRGRFRVLVATDVAARGLDVDGVTDVFNFNLPMEPEAYVHRIGRTGRAGATGRAVSFCSREERRLLRDIESLTRTSIEEAEIPSELGIAPERSETRRKRRAPKGPGQPHAKAQRNDTKNPAPKPKRKKNAKKTGGAAKTGSAPQKSGAAKKSSGPRKKRAGARPGRKQRSGAV